MSGVVVNRLSDLASWATHEEEDDRAAVLMILRFAGCDNWWTKLHDVWRILRIINLFNNNGMLVVVKAYYNRAIFVCPVWI